jgi:Skp family chaperone for outer membrane proteins
MSDPEKVYTSGQRGKPRNFIETDRRFGIGTPASDGYRGGVKISRPAFLYRWLPMAMVVGLMAQLNAQDTAVAPKARPVEASLFAVVDLAKVFAAHPEAVKAQEKLNSERSAMRDEFKKKSEVLKKALQQHQQEIRAGKKEAAVETLKQVNVLEKEIAAMRSTQQRALEERFADEKSRILALIQKAIGEHNADGRYALVLDSSAASANGLPTVLDASGSDDITDLIIRRVKQHKTDSEQ